MFSILLIFYIITTFNSKLNYSILFNIKANLSFKLCNRILYEW